MCLTCLQVPGGWAAQLYGGRVTLIISFFLWSLVSMFTPTNAKNTHTIMAARVLIGIAQGFIIPSVHTVLSQVRSDIGREGGRAWPESGHLMGDVVISVGITWCPSGSPQGYRGRGGEGGRATLGGIRGQVGKEGGASEQGVPRPTDASMPSTVDPASRAGESGVLDDIRHVPRISSSYVGPAQPVGHLRSGLTAADRRGAGDGVAGHVAHSGERDTTQVRQPTLRSCATRGSRRRPSCLVMAGCYDCCCLMKDPAMWWSIRHEHCLAPCLPVQGDGHSALHERRQGAWGRRWGSGQGPARGDALAAHDVLPGGVGDRDQQLLLPLRVLRYHELASNLLQQVWGGAWCECTRCGTAGTIRH